MGAHSISFSSSAGKSRAFSDLLSGKNVFYNAANYLESTERDMAVNSTLPVSYRWNTQHKIIRIAKVILSILFFPIGIYQFLHALVGKIALLPASTPLLMGYSENYAHESRTKISLNSEWKYKRIAVEVDGYKIDATIFGKASTLGNGRWVLASNGNGEFYEDKLTSGQFKQILSEVKGNALVFNYPGVGASSGMPSRGAMAKVYRALLAFLEDQKKGVAAKEIIGYGHSIGGGVQGEALRRHKLKKEIKYVFVKSRTFTDLATTASILTGRPILGFLVKILGWNMSSVKSSKQLQAPEIIMQTAQVKDYEDLNDSSKIIDDGVIPAKASLAKKLLQDKECPKHNKTFIGIREQHNDGLKDPSYLAQRIKAHLSP